MHGPRFVNLTVVIGIVLALLSAASYSALQYATAIEQAKSAGVRSLGVAAVGMVFGIPALLFALGSALSFVAAIGAALYSRWSRSSQ